MSSASLILLLTVCFIIFEKATSSTTPYWMNNEYKFTCTSECSKYLKGGTYNCMAASPQGLAAGRLIIRLLPNLDWRYYRIYEDRNTKDLCKSVMAADEFYQNGNKTLCRSITHKGNGKRNTDDPMMEKLVKFVEKITNSAEKIQQEAMVIDELTDSQDNADVPSNTGTKLTVAQTKRLLSLVGSLSKNVFGVEELINSANIQDINNNQQYPPKSYQQNPKVYQSGVQKPSRRYSDDKTDALCFWASRDVCQKKQMVVCVHNVCCWAKLDPNLCDVNVSSNDGINTHRESLFHIIQATKVF